LEEKLEPEIERKSAGVSFHSFVQVLGCNTVKTRQIRIQHNSGAAHKEDFLTDKVSGNYGLLRGCFHWSTRLRFQSGTSKQCFAGYLAACDKASFILFTGKNMRSCAGLCAQDQMRMGMMM
jgi:hypothetical protein